MSTAHKIKEIRKSTLNKTGKKISGISIADKLGITPQYYYDIERGTRTLSAEHAVKIADILGVSVDYLLGLTDNNDTIPSWATAKDKRDFKKMLDEDDDLMFDGVPIESEDRQRIKDVLTGLFWEAKQMNKRKKKIDSANDTKK